MMAPVFKVLVCGSRGYTDQIALDQVLTALHREYHFTCLIHGNATGADQLADKWAHANGVERVACPADWKRKGRAAGPIRNQQMLEMRPNLVIAFPGGTGTKDMVRRATKVGITVIGIS